jgi:hypothetical protein
MNYKLKNNTGGNLSVLENLIEKFFPYAQKNMGFDQPVNIVLESDLENAQNPLGKTAYYSPSDNTVVLYTDNRHPKDLMRSLSHELVHHKQNCNGELSEITGEQGYAQTETGSRIEEEAYSLGNKCFRNWEDGVKKRTNETSYNTKGGKKMKLTEAELRKKIKQALSLLKRQTVEEDEKIKKLQEMDPKRARELGGAKMATPGHQELLQQTINDAKNTLALHDAGKLKLMPHIVDALAALVGGAGVGSQPGLDLDEPMYETTEVKEDEPLDESWWEETDPKSWEKPCPKGQVRDESTGECSDVPQSEEERVMELGAGRKENPLKEWWEESLYTDLVNKFTRRNK